ncbi:MAG: hypothetical protein AUH43_22990 [Acidobacteria bacterium 13_1_40CM_65_14]|nr:MAG: hypothetical protein AUH43_22990 [Acidobacteria bacterium 13_1_40CM_65_14]OLE82728.1 MAG: hypothetical protein AUF76_08340 [Acidobacteria bacterium 13_1_20CM_2_65_9]
MGDLDETVSGALERGGDSRLNSTIAILVALAATFMALGNIKDGNIGQAMAQAQSQAVDSWSFYQAKSTKENLAEATRDQLKALRAMAGSAAGADLDKRIADYEAQVARYEKEKGEIKAQAEGYQHQYEDLNLHDDQFDLSDAAYSVAIALLGVTALTRKRWLLGLAGVFLTIGVMFEVAGFLNWSLHPNALMRWLS